MPDDYAKTERRVPVFDPEEHAKPVEKKLRPGEGPEWAGTLSGLEAQPKAAPGRPPSIPAPLDPSTEAPLSDRTVRQVPAHVHARPGPPPPPAGADLKLQIGLGLVVAAIVIVVVGLTIAL